MQKRKAQNRAAQRAFRERKEKHVKDLEIKVEELQKLSDSTNQENGLLRAQVDRMQAELQQYRGRLSLLTHGNGASAMGSSLGSYPKGLHGASNDFLFDFPKFGELPGSHLFNNGKPKGGQNQKENVSQIPGILRRDGLGQPSGQSAKSSPQNPAWASPASRAAKSGSGAPTSNSDRNAGHPPHANPTRVSPKQTGSANDTSNSDSPSSSSDSHQSQLLSSNGTSPESSPNFADKPNKDGRCDKCKTAIDGEKSFCDQLGLACGNINNPVPAMQNNSGSASNTPHHTKPGNSDLDFGLDFLTQQNGGQFDPVLFGDWREPQDAILSQDFGSYFNDAFPLPDLGSPSHNFAELDNAPAKKDPTPQADNKLDEEVVPGEDKSQMLTCTKIWYVFCVSYGTPTHANADFNRDRLQSMDKFRNGEIDVDNLCSELRTKARCSEGGVVVNQKDVDDIMGKK